MTAEVVSIGHLTDQQAASIEEAGVKPLERVDLADLDLPEPQYGETFSFHAEPDEAAIFVELHEVTQKVERQTRDLMADTMSQMGDKVRASELGKPWHEIFTDGGVAPEISEERGEEYFKLAQRQKFLHGLLYWKVGERANAHGYRFGMRKPQAGDDRMRVYKLGRRW